MASPVVRDHSIAALPEEQHLPVPIVSAQRPTVREDNGLSRAPVLVINLCSIFGCNSCHKTLSFVCIEKTFGAVNRSRGTSLRQALLPPFACPAPSHGDSRSAAIPVGVSHKSTSIAGTR